MNGDAIMRICCEKSGRQVAKAKCGGQTTETSRKVDKERYLTAAA
jgi:hypothetical protein